MIPNRNFNFPNPIRFGAGRVKELPEFCKAAGMKKPLFVTDKGLAGTDMVAVILANLKKSGLGVAMFSDVRPNPSEDNVTEGCKAFRAGGPHCDKGLFERGLDVGKRQRLAAWILQQEFVDVDLLVIQRADGVAELLERLQTHIGQDGKDIGQRDRRAPAIELEPELERRVVRLAEGPVEKALVLEVAFDSVHTSSRHKSGLAMRFPRIHRIRTDKPAAEADRISTLQAMVT